MITPPAEGVKNAALRPFEFPGCRGNIDADLGPVKILYLDHTAQFSGGEIALYKLIASLDRSKFTPVVALAADGPFRSRLEDIGAQTLIVPLDEFVANARKEGLGAERCCDTKA